MKKTVEIIQEKGVFSMIDFCTSHNQILYRKHDLKSKINTDLLFSGVSYIELPTKIKDCTIRRGNMEDILQAKQKFDYPFHSNTFIVEQSGHKHYLVAASIMIQSNDLNFSQSRIPIKSEPPMSTEDILSLAMEFQALQKEHGLDWVLEHIVHNSGNWDVLK